MGNARVAQSYVELAVPSSSNARISETYLEAVAPSPAKARVAQAYVEIIVADITGFVIGRLVIR